LIQALLSYLQTAASGADQVEQNDIINTISLLDVVVSNSEGAAQIRKDNMIPQLIEYLNPRNEELSIAATNLLRHISQLDRSCEEEVRLRIRNNGNTGATPHRAT